MSYYIGIDLGTSAMKGILLDESGNIVCQETAKINVINPREGWVEQNPADWIDALNTILKKIVKGHEKEIAGISFGGQMHGLVAVDKEGRVIRPCILWNDGRTESQTIYLNEEIGRARLSAYTGNIAFAGFTAPKILWLKENEPQNFAKIYKIMLPKDYLAYYLSGVYATDYSDASGTLLLDVKNKCWSKEMVDICGIGREMLPELHESFDVIGNILPEIAENLCLPKSVKVVIGAGDNAAAAIGTGSVNDSDCNISIGTSGTIFICQNAYSVDEQNALHSFAHANGKWHLMGCILSAANCRKWWLEEVIGTDNYDKDEEKIKTCNSGSVYFLPYLNGERSPHNDVNAKGAFIGLTATTTRAQMSRAVMEGVAFAIRDSLEIAKKNGLEIRSANLCGGGARSHCWRQIIADVLNLPINILATEQGPSYGAAILAAVGCGKYENVCTASKKTVKISKTILPSVNAVKNYNEKYQVFSRLYPALKELHI